jgi:hypothetical protein
MLYRTVLVMFLALVAWLPRSASADADECGLRTHLTGTVFTLSINRSFDPGVKFEVCARKAPEPNFLRVVAESKLHSDAWTDRTITLDDSEYAKLLTLYEAALEYNVKDDAIGLDGSSWCLETTRGFTYSKACFWSPQYKTLPRRLSGMWALGEELWRLAELDSKRLY